MSDDLARFRCPSCGVRMDITRSDHVHSCLNPECKHEPVLVFLHALHAADAGPMLDCDEPVAAFPEPVAHRLRGLL